MQIRLLQVLNLEEVLKVGTIVGAGLDGEHQFGGKLSLAVGRAPDSISVFFLKLL